MKKNIFILLLSVFYTQSAFSSCEEDSVKQRLVPFSTALVKAPQDLSGLPVGTLDLEADLLILNNFTQKEIRREIDPTTQKLLQKMGQEIDTHALSIHIKPFLSKSPPKKSVDTIRKFDAMQTAMTHFLTHFHCLFNLVLSDESEKIFGHIDIDTTHQMHVLFQETTRAFLRLSNAYCALLENKDPALFQNFYGTIPSKNDRPALAYLKEKDNFFLVPLGGVKTPLFLGRHNHSTDRHFLNSGILYQNQKVVQNPGLILTYDRDLRRYDLSMPWQVSLYNGSSTSFDSLPFMFSQKNVFLTADFFTSQIQPTSLNSTINGQALKALFLEDALQISDGATNVVAGFFEFPKSEIDADLVDLLLLEDLMRQTNTNEEISFEDAQTPLLLTHMSAFYEKEPNEIFKEKEEAILEKIAGKIRQEYALIDSLEEKSEKKPQTRTKKKTRGPAKKTASSSHSAKASSSQAAQQKTPSDASILHEARAKLKALKIEGRLKWGSVLKRVNQVCSDLPALSESSSVSIKGSHIVVHTPNSSPITLVKPHKGRDGIYPDTARSFFMDLIVTGLQQNGS